MFRSGNVYGITKYLLLIVLTVSSECLAAVNRDDNKHNFTTRRPFVGEKFTVPTYTPFFSDSSPSDVEDRTIFFVVLSLSVVLIALLVYFYQRSDSNTARSSGASRVPGAVVHPPPRHLTPTTSPTAPPNSSIPMMVSFINTGYQNDSSTVDASSDVPPDYATVTIGDLTTPERSKFPTVVPKMETPPPKYLDGQPF